MASPSGPGTRRVSRRLLVGLVILVVAIYSTTILVHLG